MTPASAPHGRNDEPSPWVVRFAPLVAVGGRVLDLACGRGRHSVFFAGRGCRVVALDRDAAAIAALRGALGVTPIVADLEIGRWPFDAERFDAIVVTNYLHRALLPQLLRSVAADGVLLYETFAAGNEVYGKPSNPEFLLRPGELLSMVGDKLSIIAFEQGLVGGESPAVIQRVAAVGLSRRWPLPLPP